MGAGDVDELIFLAQIDVRASTGPALEDLEQALAEHGLQFDDLLRLRMFVVDSDSQAELERALERVLPRECWPVITIVRLRSSEVALSFDAIAAPDGRHARRQLDLCDSWAKRSRWPAVVRCGHWVLLGAVSGQSPSKLPLSERITAQTQSLFRHMEQLLQTVDSSLAEVVDVSGWLTFPMAAYKPLGEVRMQLLHEHGLLPASAAVQVRDTAERLLSAEQLLSFEATAFAARHKMQAGASTKASSSTQIASDRTDDQARPSALAPYYATARHAGGYVFTCGEIPRAALKRGASEQVKDVYEQLASYLAEYGACPADVVHQTLFVRHRRDISVVGDLARTCCGPRTSTTLVQAVDMGFRAGTDVEIKLVAKLR